MLILPRYQSNFVNLGVRDIEIYNTPEMTVRDNSKLGESSRLIKREETKIYDLLFMYK